MNFIKRNKDVITGVEDLEHLHTFKDFPVFMGCTDKDPSTDLLADMSWHISPSSGMIQLNPLVPMDIVYSDGHGSGSVGGSWSKHHKALAEFVSKFNPKNVLEIGGGHGELSKFYHEQGTAPWTIVEPNPHPVEGVKATYIKGFFDNNFTIDSEVDVVVHSHVFEHIFDLNEFMEHVSGFMKEGTTLIFSLPNMQQMIERKFTNIVNFEHTVLLTDHYVEYLLAKFGYSLLEKEYFLDDHSIFYSAKRIDSGVEIDLPDLYTHYKDLFTQYVDYHKKLVDDINNQLTKPAYLFGAHVFGQFMLGFGLDKDKIICVLDNDTKKQGKRLYGTDLIVNSPKILKGEDSPIVILRAGTFTAEIEKDILENINPTAIIIKD